MNKITKYKKQRKSDRRTISKNIRRIEVMSDERTFLQKEFESSLEVFERLKANNKNLKNKLKN